MLTLMPNGQLAVRAMETLQPETVDRHIRPWWRRQTDGSTE